MKTRWLPLVVMAFGFFSLVAGAADWPQWRGPQRDGVSRETGLLQQWPEGGPKLLWQITDIGLGYSTPAVVGERLYLLGNEGMDDEFVESLDIKDGKRVWLARLGKVGPNQGPPYPGARSTPTVDGERLYALGSDGDLACLETATGKPLWQKNLRSEFGGKPGTWAYSESPLVDGDVLVCTPGGAEATLVALDKQTGEVIWKSAVADADQAAYASVIVVEAEGVKQYVQFLQKGVVGVDAKTGTFLWRYDATAKGSPANIPTPVAHAGQVYSGTGRGGGGLVKLRADNGQFIAEQVYFDKGLPTAIGGAVLLDGFLYGTNGQALICAEFASGKVQWQDRCIGTGAVCFADGCLYIHGENGEVALVEAKSDAYHELGRFTPPDQPDRGRSKAWAYPVVSGGRLFVRDMNTLWCYDVAVNTK
jgi:outer membrane protein assembly factor BamB